MIPRSKFGRTGHDSSRTLFGGVALADVNQYDAEKTLELLFSYGVNHIDTARDYGDAELRIGPWMKQHREEFFLATKTGKRTYKEAIKELYDSLKRLEVDQLDLWQIHALTDPEEWNIVFGSGGALEALVEAREKGLVRFLGITGHGYHLPAMHMKSLEKFDFDSVLLPYNYFMMNDEKYAADFNKLANICMDKNVAVQTIKSLLKGPWGGKSQTHATWYEPLTDKSEIEASIFYSMSRPGIFINTIGDLKLLPAVLKAADDFGSKENDVNFEEILRSIKYEPLFPAVQE